MSQHGGGEGGNQGVEHQGRGRSNSRDCGMTAKRHLWHITMSALSEKKEGYKKKMGVQLCSRFTFQKILRR